MLLDYIADSALRIKLGRLVKQPNNSYLRLIHCTFSISNQIPTEVQYSINANFKPF